MAYAVLTTKHHDGFTLFPCAQSGFGVGQTLPGRDLVAEFVDAVRAEGLRVGFYFSLADWHHPDYPAFHDGMRPYPMLAYPRPDAAHWERFLADLRAQLTHLLTAYGTIDLLWFDGGWERTASEWRALELERLIRRLQPDIVLNDRLPGVGDYDTPEQTVPSAPPERPWETCLTMNHSWGNVAADREWKSPRYLLGVLAEVVGAGGRLLLNVSPDGRGQLPDWQAARLEVVAAWMERHGAAVAAAPAGLASWRFPGPVTRTGERTYLFCPMRPQECVVLRGVYGRRITAVRALGSGRPLPFALRLSAIDRVLGGDPVCDVVIETPNQALDPLLTVIEVVGPTGVWPSSSLDR
jgi:alpha-L-fucosidase